ncbi:factor activating pos9 [Xylographa opegraphella]|nr:factor activating pos9 [Xylographa opegraphella]
MARNQPNIIMTGTPGVGKTSHAELLAQSTGLKHLSINQIVKDRSCHEGWDAAMQTWIVDEDKLLDVIEDEVKTGGNIIDWHACDLFPRNWIDLVVVLRTDSTNLYDRLKARGYPEGKLQENLDSEIMEVVAEEAREAYDKGCVVELWSRTVEEMEGNVERVEQWVQNWRADNQVHLENGPETGRKT